MTTKALRFAGGAVVAVLLIYSLSRFGGLTSKDIVTISPGHAALAVLFSMFTVTLRALNYKIIAGPKVSAPFGAWLDLGAAHQFIFTAIPSGLGDLGFPTLARRHVGLEIAQATAVISMARARDLLALPMLACAGLIIGGYLPLLAWAIVAGLGFIVVRLEQFLSPARILFTRIAPWAATATATDLRLQLARTSCTLLSWASAALAVRSAYTAAGADLSMESAFVLMAGLNLIGLLAFTIGGLGTAEVGSAGVLVFLGYSARSAAHLSIIARPLLLASVLVACALWWAIRRVYRKIHLQAGLSPQEEALPSINNNISTLQLLAGPSE